MLIQEQMGVGGVVKFMAFVILLSSFAAADSRSKQKALEQSQLNVIHGSQDINDDMVVGYYLIMTIFIYINCFCFKSIFGMCDERLLLLFSGITSF